MRPDFLPREVFREYLSGSVLNKYVRVGGIQANSYIARCDREGRPLPSKMRDGSRVYRLLDIVARARADCLAISPPETKKIDEARELERFRAEFGKLQFQSLWNVGTETKATAEAAQDRQEAKRVQSASPFQPLRDEKAAVYKVDGVSVDVTDLLNTDFEILDVLSDAMARLPVHFANASAAARAMHLSRVLTRVMDLQADRVLKLHGRLSNAAGIIEPAASPNVKPEIVEQCNRLNRLRDYAETNDYIALHTGGQDNFSAMSIPDLQEIIPPDKWQELQIRLRARQMLTPANVTKAARWVARGLEVRHAAVKIQVDNEVYATDSRSKSAR